MNIAPRIWRERLLLVVTLGALIIPERSFCQEDMWSHVYWKSFGMYEGQQRSGRGLSYLGKLNDTIQHAIAIGEWRNDSLFSSLVFNNRPGDTARHYEFPGQTIIRGNMNGDSFPDFVCWNSLQKNITVFFGTPKVDSFSTALFLQGTASEMEFLDHGIIVTDADSDGLDDLIVADNLYAENRDQYPGRIAIWKGGKAMDSLPTKMIVGHNYPDWIGEQIGVGNVRGGQQQYLCELRYYGNIKYGDYDTTRLFLYPLGKQFQLVPTDSITLTHDTSDFGLFNFGFAILDIDGDGTADICTTSTDLHYKPDLLVDATITVYKGGQNIDHYPTYLLHRPIQTYGSMFGWKLIDVGDVSGKGYHSLLATDQDAYQNAVGAVFLFDIGKGFKDSCFAYAIGQGSDANFGIEAIALGDVNNDKKTDIMIGSNADDLSIFKGSGLGQFVVFLGNANYGWKTVGVDGPMNVVQGLTLSQNYPNPFSTATTIDYSVSSSSTPHEQPTLALFDLYGRMVKAVRCTADGNAGTAQLSGSHLPAGCYLMKLSSGSHTVSRMITVEH